MCHRTSVTLPHPPARSALRRAGFTLIEILVVMGIIVLLIALALPAFNFMTGARSIEASSNQLAAALGIARADAIGIQDDRGVVVYHNAASGRDDVAEVRLKSYPFSDFSAGSTGPGGTTVSYELGQYVRYPTGSSGKSYVCIQAYVDSGANTPNNDATHWRVMQSAQKLATGDKVLEFVLNHEYASLPTGISVRGLGNTVIYTDSVSGNPASSRYFNPAVCMFDATGQIVLDNFFILYEGLLGDRLGAANGNMGDDPVSPHMTFNTTWPLGYDATLNKSIDLQSQLGFVFSDTEIFKNVAAGFTPAGQDAWLDQNATPVMVNRYNGTLVKGE
ncbi:MAG: pilus assembly FimT family protein [Tepidisphaeraceae bacterium]